MIDIMRTGFPQKVSGEELYQIALYDADPNAFKSLRRAGCIIEAVNAPKHDIREIDAITHQQGMLSVNEVLDTIDTLARTTDQAIMEILTHSLE